MNHISIFTYASHHNDAKNMTPPQLPDNSTATAIILVVFWTEREFL